jgi:hypothetical protein
MSTILRGPYTIAPDSTWTDAAARWPVTIEERLTEPGEGILGGRLGPDGLIIAQDEGRLELTEPVPQFHVVCAECGQSVLCASPGTGQPYQFATADQLAAILSHLRRSHPHVVES